MESVSTNVVTQEDFEVTIERILPGGLGLAHADGRTVMVALAAPGDRVRVSIDRVKGSVAFAQIQEIISPSPQRVEPPCQYFGRCGGCDFQQLTYQAQLDAKVEIIKDCLHRIGRIERVPDFRITPAPNPWHYRTRAQWQYDALRRKLGYFASGSRHVCDVDECAVLAPQLQLTLSDLRQRMQDGSLPDDARDFRAVAGDDGVSLALDCVRSPTLTPGLEGRGSPTVREGSDLEMPGRGVRGVTRSIQGEIYHFNAESFFQAHDDLLPQLIDAAVNEASGGTAVELYCGVGLFTVPLARRFTSVVAIESDAAATRFARENLATAGLTNAEVLIQDVAGWLEENLECAGNDGDLDRSHRTRQRSAARTPIQSAAAAALQSPPDFLLLDPPRTGAESLVIAGILNLKPKRVSYVSCDPATLARDLRKLIAGGYNLAAIAAFDMFPQTHHVESVVHLLL